MTIGCYYQTADNLLVGLFNDDDPAAAPSGQAIATMTADQYAEVMAGVRSDSNFTVDVEDGVVVDLTEIEDAETPDSQVNLVSIADVEWTSYTFNAVPGSGSFGGATNGGGRYQRIGKTVNVQAGFGINTNNTAADYVDLELPFDVSASAFQPIFAGLRILGGVPKTMAVYGVPGTKTIRCYLYDGTYPGATLATLIVQGLYETDED